MASRIAATALAALVLPACASPQPDVLDRFEATLAAHDSATAALGSWCAQHGMASPARITAAVLPGGMRTDPPDLAALLQLDAPPGYRHVRLSCGGRVLSEAHNWFVPQHLTPAMNAALAASDVPFGKVAAPLRYTRQRLSSLRGAGPGCPDATILTHRALLRLPDGAPLALLTECYTAANLRR
ncbi:hypothetical protein [Novosphingobium sp.]|uniref:hypothetical protein n=1 Tax=Novosphingobium sp. TaxID=1874826 RepID=UPI0027351A1F|nr:hypothetical protein [Novosphingobium sp.]MDP3907911.1 hypothetical protein [Novosphingobium sp.]